LRYYNNNYEIEKLEDDTAITRDHHVPLVDRRQLLAATQNTQHNTQPEAQQQALACELLI